MSERSADADEQLEVLQITLKPPLAEGGDFRVDLFHLRGSSPRPLYQALDHPLSLDRVGLLARLPQIDEHGRELSQRFFASPELRRAWHDARQRADGRALRVQLQLTPEVEALHAIPWESLCEPDDKGAIGERPVPLALVRERGLARYILPRAGHEYAPERRGRPRTLLALVADPHDLNAVRADLDPIDAAAFAAALRPLQDAAGPGLALELLGHRIDPARPASLEGLAVALGRGADILCLVCHGASAAHETTLYLEEGRGATALVSGGDLLTALAGAVKPQLVVLAVCESGGSPYQENEFLTSIGPRLAREGVGAVVCMQGGVSVAGMTRFLPALIRELLAVGAVDQALTRARAAIRHFIDERGNRCDDWWRPVLYMQPLDGRLWRDRRQAAPATDDLKAHLAEVRDRCSQLPVDLEELARYAPPLNEVFVDLHVRLPAARGAAARAETPRQALASHRWLALTGESGSGKESFVRYLAYGFSLRKLALLNGESDRDASEHLGPCAGLGPLTPVFVDLPALDAALAEPARTGAAGARAPEALWSFLRGRLGPELAEALAASPDGLFLAFSGLDAVIERGGEQAPAIALLRQLPDTLPGSSGVVTGEPRARVALRNAQRWAVRQLEPLTREQQIRLAQRWFASRAGDQPIDAPAVSQSEHELLRDLRDSPALRAFASTPRYFMALLLPYMSETSAGQRRRSLGRLFSSIVGNLLAPAPGPRREAWWEKSPAIYRSLLARLADRLTWQEGEGAATVDEDALQRLVAEHLRAAGLGERKSQLEQALALTQSLRAGGSPFLRAADERLDDGPASFSFRLATVQHFLAAEALCNGDLILERPDAPRDVVSRGLDRAAAGAHWHEVLRFAAASLGQARRSREVVYLAEELLRRARAGGGDARLLVLAAGLLAEIDPPAADRDRPARVRRAVTVRLARAVQRGAPAWLALAPAERIRAGQLLAALGDARPEVVSLRPAWGQWFAPGAYQLHPGGEPVSLPAFCVARFPVTNAQFDCFRAEGYGDRAWWKPDLGEFHYYGISSDPDPDLESLPNQPVTGISWYEADAFCRWLTARARAEGWLDPPDTLRLPAPAEWLAAAFCAPQRASYSPWSAGQVAQLRQLLAPATPRPLPIGLFPELASPAGVEDSFGTLLEWSDAVGHAGGPGDWPESDGHLEESAVVLGAERSERPDEQLRRPWEARQSIRSTTRSYEIGFRVVWLKGG